MILSTSMEHHSNDLPWRDKYDMDYINVNSNGTLSIEDLKLKLKKYENVVKLVTVTGASNVTGAKNPIYDIAKLLSVIKKENLRPVTPPDLSITAKPSDLPLIIINDGILFEDNLAKSGVDKNWLMTNLSMYNVRDISSVLLATIDKSKRLYVSKKD